MEGDVRGRLSCVEVGESAWGRNERVRRRKAAQVKRRGRGRKRGKSEEERQRDKKKGTVPHEAIMHTFTHPLEK